jgi:hypothetical protein
LDLNNVLSVSNLVKAGLAVETGGLSLLVEQAMTQAAGQIATEAFSGALSELGVTGSQNQMLADLFKGAFDLSSGNISGLTGDVSSLANDFVNAAYQSGGLSQFKNDLQDALLQTMRDITQNNSRQQSEEGEQAAGNGKGGVHAGSFLLLLAEAMGQTLGKEAGKLMDLSQQMNGLANANIDPHDTAAMQKNGQQFNTVVTEYQAEAQQYGLLSNAFSTAIKALGDGMSQMARKS